MFYIFLPDFVLQLKICFFGLNLANFNPLLLPFDAVICALSDFRDYRVGMAWRMERKHAKAEGIQEVGGTTKLSA